MAATTIRETFSDDQPAARKNREGSKGAGQARVQPKLAKALRQRHPHWTKKRWFWQKVLDLFEAENLALYIHRHARESIASWQQRAKRIAYRNYINTVVSLFPFFIFSKTITRSAQSRAVRDANKEATEQGKPQPVESVEKKLNMEWEREFLNNVDRNGIPIDRFMATAGKLAFLFDKVYLLLDLPRDQKPTTEDERTGMAYRPYVSLYTPLDAVDFEVDEDGKLLWIRFIETPAAMTGPLDVRDDRLRSAIAASFGMGTTSKESSSPTPSQERRGGEGKGGPVQYRTIDREGGYVHVVDGDNVQEKYRWQHGLGEVPVVSVYGEKGVRFPFGGQSKVADIATLCQEILNLDSLIGEALYQQTLSILVMGRQAVEGDEIVISEQCILEISPNGVAPYYLTPSQAPVQFMEQRIQVLAGEIYRLSKFSGGFGLEPKAVAPTTAAYEFNLTNRSLADAAANLEAAELEIHRIFFKYLGREFQGYVEYPEDFSIESYEETLRVLALAKQAIRSPFVRRELEKKAARRLLASHDEMDSALADWEIDMIPEEVQGMMGVEWYDPLTQEKSSGQGIVVGALAEVYREKNIDPAQLFNQQQVEKTAQMAEANQPPEPPGQGGGKPAGKPGGAKDAKKPSKP